MLEYQPVILIGAPRSGTNMLRDVLTRFDDVGTWPCDEINYIWRHRNRSYFSDEFSPEFAAPEVKNSVRTQFDKLAYRKQLRFVVEKTCANSLRVGFIDRIFPDAKYIFLVRDGRDTTASTMKRWTAHMDLPYTLRKARFVPISDIPYYGIRFILNRFVQLVSRDKKINYWGPIFDGMSTMLKGRPLAEVCAVQWKKCVNNSERDFSEIDPERVCRVQYETFVSNPIHQLNRIASFLGLRKGQALQRYVSDVTSSNVGKWQNALNKGDLAVILPQIQDELTRYGYAKVQTRADLLLLERTGRALHDT